MLYPMYNSKHPELALYPPGVCVYLKDNKYILSDDRLIPNTYILNENKELSREGDVMVYTVWPTYEYYIGQLVCSGPGGLVDFMREKEIKQFPNAILGTVIQIINDESLRIHLF